MSRAGNILAINQGTTNTKVVLIKHLGNVVALASRPLEQYYPQPAWVEQDAARLWQSVHEAIDECLASIDGIQPVAIKLM